MKKLKQENNMIDFEIDKLLAIGNVVFTILKDKKNANSQINLMIKLLFLQFLVLHFQLLPPF